MSKRRAYVVINNKKGTVDEEAIRDAAEKFLVSGGYRCEYFVRREKGESRRDATRRAIAEGYNLVIAAGGDGTVSKVADELQNSKSRLGIVPVGTANLVARSLNLPLDIAEAMKLIANSRRTRAIDGMHVQETGQTYFSHISLGVYSQIAKQESDRQKRWLGRGIYVWNMFKGLWHGRTWEFSIDADGQQEPVRSSLVVVANAGNVGIRQMAWGSRIDIDDGQLDLCIVSRHSLGAYARLAWHSLRGRPEAASSIRYVPVRERVRIESESDIPVRADGKIIADNAVTVELRRGIVPVVVG